jgi:ribonuclease HI
MSSIDYEVLLIYFHGACQGHPPICRVGVILYVNHNHYIFIRYAPGAGTNNITEFIALWTLLEAANKKDLQKLQVMGDSKLVIDCARKKNSTQDIRLFLIMKDIKSNFQSIRVLSFHHILRPFEWLSFHHILRELNSKANALSKEALPIPAGAFGFYKYIEGEEVESMEFRL